MSDLQVTYTDFQETENAAAHRTSEYLSSYMVVRRAAQVPLTCGFNRPVQPEDDLMIIAETGPSPSVQRNTKAEMPVSSSGSETSWSAVRGTSSNTNMTFIINIPPNACIGKYTISLQISNGGRTNTFELGSCCVLFNPWSNADTVYMEKEAEREEYVLRDTTAYWFGINDRKGRAWNCGQFETDILDNCIAILDTSPEHKNDPATDVSLRNDPIYLCRTISAMINSNDNDRGIVVGNWSGKYDGGVRPTLWDGTPAILRAWKENGPVKYGQCWVFAGVFCTVMRCLGIPTRMITNFNSAHDNDGNAIIDYFYYENGEKNESKTSDSVWNFHVWNECYMKRPDLGSSYDGWQALDGTPQERSGGKFRLGPCSVKAVKEGELDKPYDVTFVYSEMNADVTRTKERSDGTWELVSTDTTYVGKRTCTKAIDSFEREDVISTYKYEEGSDEAAAITAKVRSQLDPPRRGFSGMGFRESVVPSPEPQFSGYLKKLKEDIFVGEDLKLDLMVNNKMTNPLRVNMTTTATSVVYNNKQVETFHTISQSITLGPNEEKHNEVIITYGMYKSAITPDNMIQVVVLCVDENGGNLLIQEVFTLKNPDLLLAVVDDAKIGEMVTVDAIFTIPNKEEVHDCVLTVQGSGLLSDQLIINLPDLPSKERHTIPFSDQAIQIRCSMSPGRFDL